MPALERLVLEFNPQNLAKFLGGERKLRFEGHWSLSDILDADILDELRRLVGATYERESAYLDKTEPDRVIALTLRIPYGSFCVLVRKDGVETRMESDHTLVRSATAREKHKLMPQMFTATWSENGDYPVVIGMGIPMEVVRLQRSIRAGHMITWRYAKFDFM